MKGRKRGKRSDRTEHDKRCKYDPDAFPLMARWVCIKGGIDTDLAELFKVTIRTIWRWKVVHPEFGEAVAEGKTPIDNEVEEKLLECALGKVETETLYYNAEGEQTTRTVTKHAPNLKAIEDWLYNRRRKEWKRSESRELSGPGGKPLIPERAGQIHIYLPDNERGDRELIPVEAAGTEKRDNGGSNK